MAASDRPVVSNTTPLINLAGVGLLGLLPEIYGTITISTVVQAEYAAGMRPGDPLLDQLPWLRIVERVPFEPTLPHNLDRGEAATIRLALAVHAGAVLLDEQLARRVALAHGLPIVGTLGVLLAARQTNLIPAIRPVIDQIRPGPAHQPDPARHDCTRCRRRAIAAQSLSEQAEIVRRFGGN